MLAIATAIASYIVFLAIFPVSHHFAICIPCYNESANIHSLYSRICNVTDQYPADRFSIIFADNASLDKSVEIITNLASIDSRVGLIENLSNFGFVRSSANVLLAPNADANIFLMADLQDPPEVLPALIDSWKTGSSKVVFAVRKSSHENPLLFVFKRIYYSMLSALSDYPMVRNTTGFGIYDRSVIKALRNSIDSYPFIKGLVCAMGVSWTTVPYTSSQRTGGSSSASLSFLVDFGVLGIVTSSRKPLRVISLLGFQWHSLLSSCPLSPLLAS